VARNTPSWEKLSLYTERICLRTPTPEDAEALYDLFADAEVMRGLNKDPVSAVEEARALIEAGIGGWRTDGLGPFIVETAATDRQVVGQAGLMIFDTRGWTPSTCSRGVSLAGRDRIGARSPRTRRVQFRLSLVPRAQSRGHLGRSRDNGL
jgi:RimJ/RimL family protein N-acetyltransferase